MKRTLWLTAGILAGFLVLTFTATSFGILDEGDSLIWISISFSLMSVFLLSGSKPAKNKCANEGRASQNID